MYIKDYTMQWYWFVCCWCFFEYNRLRRSSLGSICERNGDKNQECQLVSVIEKMKGTVGNRICISLHKQTNNGKLALLHFTIIVTAREKVCVKHNKNTTTSWVVLWYKVLLFVSRCWMEMRWDMRRRRGEQVHSQYSPIDAYKRALYFTFFHSYLLSLSVFPTQTSYMRDYIHSL